ncbi:DNA-binding NarL/FixJ family response regulator [Duganella sp. 1224]|uniref:LuxR C-terminal-related transcriptional regulator n=1 Tax=Duganella sp. 1224 TaxID=2587052 RepID=UPI00183793B4|nr:response regulator transcription factor [Duganella sp. 1224]NYE59411.1 DNA-binding NarL/FixJ family response regulator [Duganella sp. 1224]
MMDSNRTIDVLIDHRTPLVRTALIAILGACRDMRVSASPMGVAPDVIVANYATGMAHLERQRDAGHEHGPRVLILTHRCREWEVRTAVSAGARGYLLHDCGSAELVDAVRAVDAGVSHIHPSLIGSIARSYERAMLTGREQQVLNLLAQGCCNKHIARELGIGLGTVKTHVKGVFEKLGATARTHAVVLASQRGLVN